MDQAATPGLQPQGFRVTACRAPATEIYANRDYERRLISSGRRVISIDIDATLLEEIDRIRGKARRGLILDRLLKASLKNQDTPEKPMR